LKTIILLGALLATTLPASADWQGTVWGMSEKEVHNKLQGLSHAKDGSFNYTTGNIEFDHGGYSFDPDTGGLVMISMRLKNMERCEELIGVYRSIDGNPVSDEKKPFDVLNYPNAIERFIAWHDASHNNKITINTARSPIGGPVITCGVTYEPIPKPELELAPGPLAPAPGGL
jgi:hypothetical protein